MEISIFQWLHMTMLIADLVGIHILQIISRMIDPKQLGLNRDDGFIVIHNSNCPISSFIHEKHLNFSNNTFNFNHNHNESPIYINVSPTILTKLLDIFQPLSIL